MKNLYKNRNILHITFFMAAFFIPIIGMLCILLSRHFYPFGQNLLFTMDMRTQYVEFFSSLRYVFDTDNSIFCSYSRSLGGNYIGLYAYYLANPLSFLVTLFPVEKIYIGILILTLIKIGLCGLTFAMLGRFLLTEQTQDCSLQQFFLLPLSVSYALMSYNMVYSQALMWLDGVIFLPVIILSVEKLLRSHKRLPLILSLAACFWCNYYTGYMLALFASLYVLFRLGIDLGKPNWTIAVHKFGTFALCGILSGMLCAPLLIPVAMDLFSGKITGVTVDYDGITGFTLFDFAKMFLNGAYNSLTYATIPTVYFGYFAFALALAFFFIKAISRREKLLAALFLLILYFSMYFNKLNVIWHGFKAPNSYPYRDAFLFSFLCLYLAQIALLHGLNSPRTTQWKPWKCAALFLGLMLFVAADMGFNGREIFYHIEDEYDYDRLEDFENYLVTTEPFVADIWESDTDLYRVNQLYEYSKNDAMLWGYNGLAHYSSTYNQAVNDTTRDFGMAADWLWNSGYGATPLTDSLLGVKYVLARYPLPENYHLLAESGHYTYAYENPLALPLAFVAPLAEATPQFAENVFVNQNRILQGISGEALDYFSPVEFTREQTDEAWIFRFTAPAGEPLYLYIPSEEYSYTNVYVNDAFAGNYFSSETKCCLYLGTFDSAESVIVKVCPSDFIKIGTPQIYSLSMENLAATLSVLRDGGIHITSHKSGRIAGTVTAVKDSYIVTSLPYDKGWTIKIDNQKIPAICYADTFMAIPVNAGEHTITFSYVSPGVTTGMIVFFVGLIICIWFLYATRPLTQKEGVNSFSE